MRSRRWLTGTKGTIKSFSRSDLMLTLQSTLIPNKVNTGSDHRFYREMTRPVREREIPSGDLFADPQSPQSPLSQDESLIWLWQFNTYLTCFCPLLLNSALEIHPRSSQFSMGESVQNSLITKYLFRKLSRIPWFYVYLKSWVRWS